jgi:hypothetical protein
MHREFMRNAVLNVTLIIPATAYHQRHDVERYSKYSDRPTEYPLPSYAPDYHPIEYLWKKTKQRATHNKYFKAFATLTVSVDTALAYFATPPEEVVGLFGHYCEESGRVSDVHFGLATFHDLVGVTAGTKHRNEYHVALLLKKASAWHGEW